MKEPIIRRCGSKKISRNTFDVSSRGTEQGKKEGIKQNTLKIAKKMKQQKIDIETISKTTGLSVEEIKEL